MVRDVTEALKSGRLERWNGPCIGVSRIVRLTGPISGATVVPDAFEAFRRTTQIVNSSPLLPYICHRDRFPSASFA